MKGQVDMIWRIWGEVHGLPTTGTAFGCSVVCAENFKVMEHVATALAILIPAHKLQGHRN